MKKYQYKLFVLIILSLVSTIAIGDGEPYAGSGTHTCGEYITASKNNSLIKTITIEWGRGYLTFENRINITKYGKYKPLPSIDTTQAYLDKYCSDNPLDRVALAFDSMYEQLKFVKDK